MRNVLIKPNLDTSASEVREIQTNNSEIILLKSMETRF